MSKEVRERSFDELASSLASGDISRREALKWLGAALLGGALAFTPKVAQAARGSFCYATVTRETAFCTTRRKVCEERRRTYNNPTDPLVSDKCYHLKG